MPLEPLDIAIVGGGPTATYALDRLTAALSFFRPARPIRVGVFEKSGRFGCGSTHAFDQPATSYMNRASADIALGADESNSAFTKIGGGFPTFLDWARSNGVNAIGEASERPLEGDETPSRALHGAALIAAFNSYVDRFENHAIGSCRLYSGEVIDVAPISGGGRYVIKLSGSGEREVATTEYLLLVTGHSETITSEEDRDLEIAAARHNHLSYVSNPYPLSNLDSDLKAARICIKGMGLTAIDAILHLTEGRGGRFYRGSGGDLKYRSSGDEPKYITAISPSGLLITARPRNERAARSLPAYEGAFYSFDAIDRVRQSRGVTRLLPDGTKRLQVQFETDVLPLIVLEMAYVYYNTICGSVHEAALRDSAHDTWSKFLADSDRDSSALNWLVAPIRDKASMLGIEPAFYWEDFLHRKVVGPNWHEAVLKAAELDLARSQKGNVKDPWKRAIDAVWRDLRKVHNYVLDFAGLTAESEAQFHEHYLRIYHRTSNGCCREAMEKIIALGRANTIDLSQGPGAKVGLTECGREFEVTSAEGRRSPVDMVICGYLHRFQPSTDCSPLYRNMIRRQLLQTWVNPGSQGSFECGAIAVNRKHQAWTSAGKVNENITLLGTPIDGVRYFQQSAARPFSASDIIEQLTAWALDLSKRFS